jgi:hypothetical protein
MKSRGRGSEPIAQGLRTPLLTPIPMTPSLRKSPPELYPTGLAGIGLVNCIKFNSEKDVFAIAILRLRLE